MSQEQHGRWADYTTWTYGKRRLTIIDEALSGVVEENQVKADDIRNVRASVTTDRSMDGPPSLGISLRTGRHFRPRPFLLDVAGDALKRFGATVIRCAAMMVVFSFSIITFLARPSKSSRSA